VPELAGHALLPVSYALHFSRQQLSCLERSVDDRVAEV